jgi:tRNA-specific 2-thiouridylase
MASEPKRVVVAMSGGVDSSTAAAVMKERGCEVVGVTLELWGRDGGRGRCRAGADARAVAEKLGIEHHVLDGRAEFVRSVVDVSREARDGGLTPNPCILCNEHVKFGLLLEWAMERGASRVATGHYARIGEGLLRGRDRDKDQSYFLFTLVGDERLSRIEFPLGDMTKQEVRERARRLGLSVAGRRESQDLCFPVAQGDDVPGEVVDLGGRILGRHGGVGRFTVGQRRGIGVAASARLYVIALRPELGRVVVGSEEDLLESGVRVGGVVWDGVVPEDPVEVEARIRYRHEPAPARVVREGDGLRVEFETGQKAVAPGQALVCYRGEKVLGGGWIEPGYSRGGSQKQGGTRK